MEKRFGLYLMNRFFPVPNGSFARDTGIFGRKEIVTLGYYSTYIGSKEIFMYEELWCPSILIPVGKRKRDGCYIWGDITEEELKFLIQDEKRRLSDEEQLVYYERYCGEEMIGIPGFEFCGYDIFEKDFGTSAITDCGYCGFLNAESVQKLNCYGLFDDFDYAKKEQKRIRIDNPDEEHSDCEVFGIWRYLKQ